MSDTLVVMLTFVVLGLVGWRLEVIHREKKESDSYHEPD